MYMCFHDCAGTSDIATSFGASMNVTFLPSEVVKTFQVWSLQDELQEGKECFPFSLETTEVFVSIPTESSVTTVCIEDTNRK